MRLLLAAATVANHGNTKNRPLLRSVYTDGHVFVATDSYRLVSVAAGFWSAEDMHGATVKADGAGFCIPGDVIATAGKLAKTGAAVVSTDGATVTLSVAGQSFTADRPDVTVGDYPSFGQLLPNLNVEHDPATPKWDAEYLADMAKVAKLLNQGRTRYRTYSRLIVSDDLKPTLWHLTAGNGSALYLLMPVRDR